MRVKLPDLQFPCLGQVGRCWCYGFGWLVRQLVQRVKRKHTHTHAFSASYQHVAAPLPQGERSLSRHSGTFPVPEPSSRPQFTACQPWRNADWTRHRPREYQCVAMKYENCYYAAAAASECLLSVAPPKPENQYVLRAQTK